MARICTSTLYGLFLLISSDISAEPDADSGKYTNLLAQQHPGKHNSLREGEKKDLSAILDIIVSNKPSHEHCIVTRKLANNLAELRCPPRHCSLGIPIQPTHSVSGCWFDLAEMYRTAIFITQSRRGAGRISRDGR
jgi:hypothetical protein